MPQPPVTEMIRIYRAVNRKTAFCFLPRNLWTLGLIRRHEEPPATHLVGLQLGQRWPGLPKRSHPQVYPRRRPPHYDSTQNDHLRYLGKKTRNIPHKSCRAKSLCLLLRDKKCLRMQLLFAQAERRQTHPRQKCEGYRMFFHIPGIAFCL